MYNFKSNLQSALPQVRLLLYR